MIVKVGKRPERQQCRTATYLFAVVDARPDDLQASLRFQLHNADVKTLVEQDAGLCGKV